MWHDVIKIPIDGQTIVKLTGEFVHGQTIVQLTGELCPSRSSILALPSAICQKPRIQSYFGISISLRALAANLHTMLVVVAFLMFHLRSPSSYLLLLLLPACRLVVGVGRAASIGQYHRSR